MSDFRIESTERPIQIGLSDTNKEAKPTKKKSQHLFQKQLTQNGSST